MSSAFFFFFGRRIDMELAKKLEDGVFWVID